MCCCVVYLSSAVLGVMPQKTAVMILSDCEKLKAYYMFFGGGGAGGGAGEI